MMKKKPSAKMGRPKIQFDWDTLDKFLAYRASLADCAELMKCSEDTIQRNIKKEQGVTFAVYRNKKMAKTRMKLTETALHLATKGNVTMLIFSLKNLCGWTDRNDEKDKESAKELVELTMEKLKEALAKDKFLDGKIKDVTPEKKQLEKADPFTEHSDGPKTKEEDPT